MVTLQEQQVDANMTLFICFPYKNSGHLPILGIGPENVPQAGQRSFGRFKILKGPLVVIALIPGI